MLVHFESVPHPPLAVRQLLIAVHVVPLPKYPVLHAHEFMFDPVSVHVAWMSQPPLLVKQLFTQHILLCSSEGVLHVQVIFPPVLVAVLTVPPK